MSVAVAEHLLCELRKWQGSPDEYIPGDPSQYWRLAEQLMAHYGLTLARPPSGRKPTRCATAATAPADKVAADCVPWPATCESRGHLKLYFTKKCKAAEKKHGNVIKDFGP